MAADALTRMDLLWDRFEAAKSFVPYMPPDAVGKCDAYPPPPWYEKTAPYKAVLLNEPVTDQYRLWHNDMGYWLNSAFVVSLCALLQDIGIRKADKAIQRWEYITLLADLRNVFAHEDGRYDPSTKQHKKVENKIARMFGQRRQATTPSDEFPLSIDTVLKPLFLGCREYVSARGLRRIAEVPFASSGDSD